MGHKRDPFERAIKKVEKGKHWKRQDAIAVLEKLRDSGLSVLEFVRTYQLPEKRVRWWKRRLDAQLHLTPEQPLNSWPFKSSRMKRPSQPQCRNHRSVL